MFGISLLNNSLWQYQFMNHSQPQVCLWCIMKWAWQWLLIDPMAMLKCNRKQSNNNSDFLLNISYKKHPIITTIHTHIHTKSSLESPINLITACPLSVGGSYLERTDTYMANMQTQKDPGVLWGGSADHCTTVPAFAFLYSFRNVCFSFGHTWHDSL